MFHRFHAETGASGAVPNGYALLHGSNSTVGDFELRGVYSTQKAPNGDWIVPAHVNCCFNDIVDPSGNKDLPGEIVAWLMTAGRRAKGAGHDIFSADPSSCRRRSTRS